MTWMRWDAGTRASEEPEPYFVWFYWPKTFQGSWISVNATNTGIEMEWVVVLFKCCDTSFFDNGTAYTKIETIRENGLELQ